MEDKPLLCSKTIVQFIDEHVDSHYMKSAIYSLKHALYSKWFGIVLLCFTVIQTGLLALFAGQKAVNRKLKNQSKTV